MAPATTWRSHVDACGATQWTTPSSRFVLLFRPATACVRPPTDDHVRARRPCNKTSQDSGSSGRSAGENFRMSYNKSTLSPAIVCVVSRRHAKMTRQCGPHVRPHVRPAGTRVDLDNRIHIRLIILASFQRLMHRRAISRPFISRSVTSHTIYAWRPLLDNITIMIQKKTD